PEKIPGLTSAFSPPEWLGYPQPERRRGDYRPPEVSMAEVARLSTPRIRRQVGESSIHKAKAYTRPNAWSNLRIQGATIKGEVRGTAAVPYRVEVAFDGDDIGRADCSCPIGAGGHCKHVAALLLLYREHGDAFGEVEELDRALERRTQGELIALIRRMVRRVP